MCCVIAKRKYGYMVSMFSVCVCMYCVHRGYMSYICLCANVYIFLKVGKRCISIYLVQYFVVVPILLNAMLCFIQLGSFGLLFSRHAFYVLYFLFYIFFRLFFLAKFIFGCFEIMLMYVEQRHTTMQWLKCTTTSYPFTPSYSSVMCTNTKPFIM